MVLSADTIRQQVENFVAMARGENIANRSGDPNAQTEVHTDDDGHGHSGSDFDGPLSGDGTSGLAMNPIPGGTFTNDWGAPRSGGRTHEGTDIFAPAGTPVYAGISGTVRKIGGGGMQPGMVSISITGDDGNSYFYNHIAGPTINVGDRVTPKTQIASVGDPTTAGYSFAPHLHLGINESTDNAINPYTILSGL